MALGGHIGRCPLPPVLPGEPQNCDPHAIGHGTQPQHPKGPSAPVVGPVAPPARGLSLVQGFSFNALFARAWGSARRGGECRAVAGLMDACRAGAAVLGGGGRGLCGGSPPPRAAPDNPRASAQPPPAGSRERCSCAWVAEVSVGLRTQGPRPPEAWVGTGITENPAGAALAAEGGERPCTWRFSEAGLGRGPCWRRPGLCGTKVAAGSSPEQGDGRTSPEAARAGCGPGCRVLGLPGGGEPGLCPEVSRASWRRRAAPGT